jgi:hypothetical protein
MHTQLREAHARIQLNAHTHTHTHTGLHAAAVCGGGRAHKIKAGGGGEIGGS